MARTLRDLLIQRAARLQDRAALTSPDWGRLDFIQLRNRAEGIAFGLLAEMGLPDSVFAATGSTWDWAAELAAAASGLAWDPAGWPIPSDILGGSRYHSDAGRGRYHGREGAVSEETLFHRGLVQGEVLHRLAHLNDRLGWDHETEVHLPFDRFGEPAFRATLWSALYGGSHAMIIFPERPGFLARQKRAPEHEWDPSLFSGFWD
jgi:hypothetical protein